MSDLPVRWKGQEGLVTCRGGFSYIEHKIIKVRVLGNDLLLFVTVSQEETLWEFYQSSCSVYILIELEIMCFVRN